MVRRCFQFSLRGLLILVTVLALCLGRLVESAKRQRDAVDAVEAIGGVVQYDWQADVSSWPTSPESWGSFGYEPPMRYVPDNLGPPTAQRLRTLFGQHMFQDVESVIFRATQALYFKHKSGLMDVSREERADISRDVHVIAPQLHGLRKLKTIYLQGDANTVNKEVEDWLRAEFPRCQIVREPVIAASETPFGDSNCYNAVTDFKP